MSAESCLQGQRDPTVGDLADRLTEAGDQGPDNAASIMELWGREQSGAQNPEDFGFADASPAEVADPDDLADSVLITGAMANARATQTVADARRRAIGYYRK